MHEKNHIVKVLESVKNALKKEDVVKLKELSNQTIHTASTEQDTDSITLAVLVYSVGKIIERQSQYNSKECTDFCNFAHSQIEKAILALKKNDEKLFREILGRIMNSVKKLSPKIKKDIEDVFRKARINKASKIYEHGISMEQTANLLGITMYELANYAGQKPDKNSSLFKTSPEKTRIKIAMDFFR